MVVLGIGPKADHISYFMLGLGIGTTVDNFYTTAGDRFTTDHILCLNWG